jgi:hypothetical protein
MIQDDRKELVKYAVGATMMIVIIQTMLAVHYKIFDGILIGSDTYSWLNRVLHLHETGNWFDATIPRIDPPYGLEQHWTRPFDVLLFVGAWIGMPLLGFKNGLHVWGVLISPILQILALIAFFWSLRPVFTNRQIDMLGILFVCLPTVVLSFRAGRPDHQSLTYLLFIISFGFGIRLLLQPFRLRWCYGAGFVSALALWVSVESVLVILMNFLCLGLFWLLGDDDLERRLFHYSLSLLILSAGALLAQRGFRDLLQPELDQISIAFVSLFALIFAFWTAAGRVRVMTGAKLGWGSRMALAVIGAAVVAAAMEFLYPGFFAGPGPTADELYRQVRMQHIGEAHPLFWGGWQRGLTRFSVYLGIAIPSIPVLVYHLVKRRKPDVRLWAYVAIGLLIFTPRAILKIRWVPYVGILLLPGYAWLISMVLENIEHRLSKRKVLLVRPFIVLICATWFLVPAGLLTLQGKSLVSQSDCRLAPIARYLDDPEKWGDRPRNILAWADFGPELLYRSKHSVYSIPNHRFQRGFTDSYHIMSATTDGEALEIIRQRQVELILVCKPCEDKIYIREDGRETFFDRISRGEIPAWLLEDAKPDKFCGAFRLYEVRLFQTS